MPEKKKGEGEKPHYAAMCGVVGIGRKMTKLENRSWWLALEL